MSQPITAPPLRIKIDEPIQFPKEMLPDSGGVSVIASPTVIGNVSGAFKVHARLPVYLLGAKTQ